MYLTQLFFCDTICLTNKLEKIMRNNYNIIEFEDLLSTNKYASENISILNHGDVIFADNQTGGYGRFKRDWFDFGGKCLTFSIILKPQKTDYLQNLTQYASCIICSVLENFNLNPTIKWPNDVRVNGAKIAGILSEGRIQNSKLEGVVLGIGLNINLEKEDISKIDQKATSMYVLLNKNFDKKEILNLFLDKFFNEIDDVFYFGFEKIKDNYISHCDFLEKKVSIKDNDKNIEGIAKSINDDGSLNLETNNNLVIIRNGDLLC